MEQLTIQLQTLFQQQQEQMKKDFDITLTTALATERTTAKNQFKTTLTQQQECFITEITTLKTTHLKQI